MTYPQTKLLVFSFLALMALIGLTTADNVPRERYPFFSWSLFSKIPNDRDIYTIEVYEAGGKVYDPALKFYQLEPFFVNIGQSSIQYEERLRRMQRAMQTGTGGTTTQERKQIEEIFPRGAFRYRVIHVRYTPIQYWRTHDYTVLEEIYRAEGTAS